MRAIKFILCLPLLLVGCAVGAPPAPPASPLPGVTLRPYSTPAPAPAGTASPAPRPTPPAPPAPSPTPVLYTIVEGDTLIGVAFRFGLTLPDLLSANPGIDPQYLRIGDTLVIPLQGNPEAAAALPTPVGIASAVGDPACFAAADGGLWCFWSIRNSGDQPVESLSAQFTIFDDSGDRVAARVGIAPVNLLPPGSSVPIVVWFAEAGPAPGQVRAELLSAVPLRPEDPRYAPVDLRFDVQFEGLAARVGGEIRILGQAPASQVRIGLLAYGADNRVIGVRVLLLDDLDPNAEKIDFDGWVYSLAGEIDRVEVLAEAYP